MMRSFNSGVDGDGLSAIDRCSSIPNRPDERRADRACAVFGVGVAAALFSMALAWSAAAQTLDSEVERLLSDNCVVINAPAGAGLNPGFGANLNAICDFPAAGAGSSTGGTAGASQGSATSVLQRLRGAREEEGDEKSGGTGADTSAEMGKGFGVFISGDYEVLDRDRTTFEDGYDSDIFGVTAGGDYVVRDWLVAGLAFNYNNNNGDFDGGGDFDTDTYGPILFASFVPAPAFFADVAVGYAWKDYSVDRAVSFTQANGTFGGTASGDTDGEEVSVRAAAGYDHAIGNITIGPRVGLNFTHTDIDGFTETGSTGLELKFDDQDIDSLQGTVGVQASMAISTGFGVLVPQVNFDWVHEFEDDQRSIDVQFAGDLRAAPTKFSFQEEAPDRDFFELGIGLVAVLPNGLQPFANFRTLLGHSDFDSFSGSLGLRVDM